MQNENEIHLLADEFEQREIRVGAGKRFVNFIIDRIAISIAGYLLGIFLQQTDSVIRTESDIEARLINILYGLLVYALLMFLMEALTKGKSLGKLITKTRAVNESDGNPINARTAFLRSLARIVPFEPFSAFGNPSFPWHDTWTGSMVVEDGN